MGRGKIAYTIIGSGFPLLLLHGYPETHLAWHKIIQPLAQHFTVVAADLPGYGDSVWSTSTDNNNLSKRAMATALVAFMEQLGFNSFDLAGHDRGARVAYRMALDHPQKINRVAVLDIVPTLEVINHVNYHMALDMHNWLFMAQRAPLPEHLLAASSDFYIDHIIDSWAGNPGAISEEVRAKYKLSYSDPRVIHSVCEEYRATGTDIQHDEHDAQNKHRITCPLLALWAANGFATMAGDPLEVWHKWASNVTGKPLSCGHFLMEENPEEVVKAFIDFFAGDIESSAEMGHA
jgi:haloacetate dehalogenase